MPRADEVPENAESTGGPPVPEKSGVKNIKGFDPRQALVVLMKLYGASPLQIGDEAIEGQDIDQLTITRTPEDNAWLIELIDG